MGTPIKGDVRFNYGDYFMATTKDYLRSKDVAHLLDCCPDDVSSLAKSEKLRAEKIGKYWRFKLADVQEYMRDNGKEK